MSDWNDSSVVKICLPVNWLTPQTFPQSQIKSFPKSVWIELHGKGVYLFSWSLSRNEIREIPSSEDSLLVVTSLRGYFGITGPDLGWELKASWRLTTWTELMAANDLARTETRTRASAVYVTGVYAVATKHINHAYYGQILQGQRRTQRWPRGQFVLWKGCYGLKRTQILANSTSQGGVFKFQEVNQSNPAPFRHRGLCKWFQGLSRAPELNFMCKTNVFNP